MAEPDKNLISSNSVKRENKLEGLDFGNSRILFLHEDLVLKFNFITFLNLNGNLLSNFPREFCLKLPFLKALNLSNNKLRYLPNEIGYLTNLEQLLLVNNFLTEIPLEIGRLFRLKELNFQGNPISFPPPHICNLGFETVITYLRENMPSGPRPPERKFVSKSNSSFNLLDENNKVRVLTYNILADMYATPEMYYYCPSWALNWERRKKLIMEEILKYNCDIICLQEMEASQFTEYFEPELQKQGYLGIFIPKSRVRVNSDWGVDGCATFYRMSKLSLKEKHFIEYQTLAGEKHKEYGSEAFTRVHSKDNVALILILQSKNNKHVLIANTHIQWNPEFCDVKLIQVQLLLEKLNAITGPSSSWNNIPIIIAGDFNSLVNSGPYELLSQGRISPNHPDFNSFDYGPSSRNGIQHNFNFKSAYSPQELTFTNYTSTFVGVLDYLWYSSDSLAIVKILQPVSEQTVYQSCLPNPFYPSDHISLAADFIWI